MECSGEQVVAARSVHLSYACRETVALFYNEVVVKESTPGSYFMVCGWSGGYFGIQQLEDPDDKIVLFSAWDPPYGDDPCQVPEKHRVLVEDVGEAVRVRRFGGEGTGAQLSADFPWQLGETVKCCVQTAHDGAYTSFTARVFNPKRGCWWQLGTLKIRDHNLCHNVTYVNPLCGLYAFIEDFRRDGDSVGETRWAHFCNGWVLTRQGSWSPLCKAFFTASNADFESKENIDAGTCCGGFYLSTGGSVCMSCDVGSRLKRSLNQHFHESPPVLPFL